MSEGTTFDTAKFNKKFNESGTEYYVDLFGEIVGKKCTECDSIKKMCSFYKDEGKLGGRRANCRVCHKGRTNQYREDNLERERERCRQYQEYKKNDANWVESERERKRLYRETKQKDPEWVEKTREYQRQLYEHNRKNARFVERDRQQSRQYRKDNPEYFRQHCKNNPEQYRLRAQRRRARVESLPDGIVADELKITIEYFGGGCTLSGTSEDAHMDHVVPISIGHGGTIDGNIIPLRGDLNKSKGSQHIFEWFANNRERFDLSQRKFDELITYLADINEMTAQEYRKYVDWCHDNPRTIDEIKADNEAFEANQRLAPTDKETAS